MVQSATTLSTTFACMKLGTRLGLQGHSPHEDDIMYPSLSSQQGLSPRDINTMLALLWRSPGDNSYSC